MKITNSLRSRASHFFSDRHAYTRTAGFFSRAYSLRNNLDRRNPVTGQRDNNDDIEMNAITMAHKVDSYGTCCNRFVMICGSNIPTGSSQMGNAPCVILTKRV